MDGWAPTACSGSPTPSNRIPPRGSSRCWRRPSAGGEGMTSARTWRARSLSPAGWTIGDLVDRRSVARPTICSRMSGRAQSVCASCARGSGSGRSARSGRASPRRSTVAVRSSWEAAWGSRRLRSGRTHLRRTMCQAPSCSAFAMAPSGGGRRAAARRARCHRRWLFRSPRPRHRPARRRARAGWAGHRLCLRAGADAGGRQGALRDARGARPARARGGNGLRLWRVLRLCRAPTRRRLPARVRRRPGHRRGRAGSGRGSRRSSGMSLVAGRGGAA